MFSINWKLLGFLATLCVLNVCEAGVTTSGVCSADVQVVSDFDLSKYLGVWYEQEKYPFANEAGGKCIKAEYTLKPDGDVNVLNSEILIATDAVETIQGYAKEVEGAKLNVVFPVSPDHNVSSNYWVLDTDYSSYAVVYSCYSAEPEQHTTMVWILTRERNPSDDVIVKAKEVLTKNNIDLKYLEKTDQTDCDIKA